MCGSKVIRLSFVIVSRLQCDANAKRVVMFLNQGLVKLNLTILVNRQAVVNPARIWSGGEAKKKGVEESNAVEK
jgi:hypothetical protein